MFKVAVVGLEKVSEVIDTMQNDVQTAASGFVLHSGNHPTYGFCVAISNSCEENILITFE